MTMIRPCARVQRLITQLQPQNFSKRCNQTLTVSNNNGFNVPSIKLHDGRMHPLIGYGTYKVGVIPSSASEQSGQSSGESSSTVNIILDAFKAGYRFLDCAEFYENEKEVGIALKQSGLKRSEVFLASKVWNTTIYNGEKAVREQVEKSLNQLGVDYIDLYMIHWPVPGKHFIAYQVLEKLQAEGKIGSIGISNYTIEDYEELKENTTVKPVINQIEVNPFLYRKKTIGYFQKEGIMIQAYRPLRQGKEMSNPILVDLGKKYNKTPAQILGIWCIQKNIIYIPKSAKLHRMVENAQVFDCKLNRKDMSKLNELTTEKALQAFKSLYIKCVVRDTPLAKAKEGIKKKITIN